MEMPQIKSPIRDAEKNITYVVMAYRELSIAERTQAVQWFLRQKKARPKKNSLITIITTIGADGR